MDIRFDIPSERSIKERLTSGYRARRNFLILELLSMVVIQTPVKTGKARGGWQLGIGAPPVGDIDRLDKEGFITPFEELTKLKGVSPFKTVYLGNNTEYIGTLEGGSSAQAPDGIVRVVMPAFRSMYGDVT